MLVVARKILKKLAPTFLLTALVAASFTFTAPSYADDLSDWRSKLGKRIGSKMIYPKSAIRKGITGKAKVKITIDRSGEITNFEILEKTGQKALDKVIEKSITRMNPLPAPPASLADSRLSFIIPLNWSL